MSQDTTRGDLGDLVYETTRWQRHLAAEAVECDEDYSRALANGTDRFGAWPAYQREIFSRLYDPSSPKLEQPEEATAWAQEAHEKAAECPEWQRLAKRTSGDEFYSRVATTSIAEAVLDAIPEDVKQRVDPRAQRQDLDVLSELAEEGNARAGKLANRLRKMLELNTKIGNDAASKMDGGAIRQAVRKGAEAANQKMDEIEEAIGGFGYDQSAPTNGKGSAAAVKAAMAKRLQGNKRLMEIARKAGRMVRIAANQQRAKTRHAPDEVVDIERGSEISRMLASEAVRLTHPELEKTFLRDWSEKQLQQYRLDGKDPEEKGPIVFLVDESGSMQGDKDAWAKGLFIALLEVAQRQKRHCAIVPFSSKAGQTTIFDPGKPDPMKIMDAVESFMNGGTNFGPPLWAAMDIIDQTGCFDKADIVLLTDGHGAMPKPVAGKFDWKGYKDDRSARLWTIAIESTVMPDLEAMSDFSIALPKLMEGSADETGALEKILSM